MANGIKAAQCRTDINGIAHDHGWSVNGSYGMIDIIGIKNPFDPTSFPPVRILVDRPLISLQCGSGEELRHRYRANLRSRRAFAMTDTELKVIAALAIMGLKRSPKTG
jgi:hypothetical protein